MNTEAEQNAVMAAAALQAAREDAADTPQGRVLQAELVDLAARIGVLDEQLATLEPDRQAAQAAVNAIEAKMSELQAELTAAQGARRKVLGRMDSLRLTRTGLKAQQSIKSEELARLRTYGEPPVIRWAGTQPRR